MHGRWLTFDCYGTLVDWQAGFCSILRPLAGERTTSLLKAYHHHEAEVEAQRPFRPYKVVLATALLRATEELRLQWTKSRTNCLADQWSLLPVFPDVEPALADLRRAGYKIGVLTNCDDDLFAHTQRNFRHPFDLVVTAEQVGDYKPSLAHFQFFQNKTGVAPTDWIHVGCSWFHDMAPARELGLKHIWLDREQSQPSDKLALCRLESAAELATTALRLFKPGF